MKYMYPKVAQGADLRIIIEAIQSDPITRKATKYTLEDIGWDGQSVVDHLRTGGDDRSFTTATADIWEPNELLGFEMNDFATFFAARNKENYFEASTKDCGFLVKIEGEGDSAASKVENFTLVLGIQPILTL